MHNLGFFKYLCDIIDDQQQIAEIVRLSFTSINIGITKIDEGLKSNDKQLIKSGFHLITPNLVHVELGSYTKQIPDTADTDFFAKTRELVEVLRKKTDDLQKLTMTTN